MNTKELNRKLAAEKEAIQNCENEVIHKIGYIQPFGYLVAINPKNRIITHVSENCSEWFRKPNQEILGTSLNDLFSKEINHQCNNAMAHSTISTQREYVGYVQSDKNFCDVFAHMRQGRFILEMQPTTQKIKRSIKVIDNVQRVLSRIRSNKTAQALLEQAVEELHAISGFHRVKAYCFLPDGSGEVVAESKDPQVDSFLGLRFPAFDIPQAARKLYATTPIRIIPSVSADQIQILKADISQPALDLSLALFRGVVPVHTMYLENMHIKATLSLPIVIDGEMWGLFAFHHMKECMLDSKVLSAMEILGGGISILLNTIIQKQQIANIKECTRIAATLFMPDDSVLGFSASWDTASSELATLIDCNGVGLLSKDRFDTYGDCPSESTVRQLTNYFDADFKENQMISKLIAIDSIVSKYPNLNCGDIAGVLAIPNPAATYSYLLYFRKSASKNVRWAGKPTKDIYKANEGFRLNPRASFSEYIDTKHQQSDAFSQEDVDMAMALKDSISISIATVTIRAQHKKRLGLVIRELNHRVRNMLTLIGSIMTQSSDTTHSIEEFIQVMEQRLQALSETQKLLTEYNWKPIHIQNLFKTALVLYKNYFDTRIIFQGDNIAFVADMASLFTLIINELASNASKYGALSNSTGHIEINWSYNEENLIIHWKEVGGPSVKKPTRHGFGTSLITEALPYEFNSTCHLNFFPKGVEAKFEIPIKYTSREIPNEYYTDISKPIVTIQETFVALVLEDDYIIAKEMTRMLKSLGASKVDAVPSLEKGFSCIETTTYDIAFLDVNIRGEFSGEVAKLLYQKDVPFVFATGYGSKDQELNTIPSIGILTKPVSKGQLLSLLKLAKLRS